MLTTTTGLNNSGWQFLIRGTVVLAAVLIGWATLWVSHHSFPYGSPDEAANALMARQVATTGQPKLETHLTPSQLSLVHPRSLIVRGSQLESGSFLGLVDSLGVIWRWFGTWAAFSVVPILSLAAAAAFFSLLRRFWSLGWSLVGTSLLVTNPVWFQFQTLPMFHNGAFVSLLIITGYCLRRQFERPSWRWAALIGLAYGGAIFFRPVEAIWTAPLIGIVLLTMPGRWKWLMTWLVVSAALQLPWVWQDHVLYGSALATGYTPDGTFSTSQGGSILTSAVRLITPAGGHWSWHWLSSAWWYFFLILPANSALALASVFSYFQRKFVDWHKIIKLGLVSVFVIFPLVYYGSWNLYPLLPSSAVGSLSSYSRYWIPLYVAMIPGIVQMLKRLVGRPWIAGTVFSLLLASQIIMIGWHPGSGLHVRWQRQARAESLRNAVLTATPTDAVILAGQADKYLMDQRLVGSRLPATQPEWLVLGELAQSHHLYILQSVLGGSSQQAQHLMSSHQLEIDQHLSVGQDTLWRIRPSI